MPTGKAFMTELAGLLRDPEMRQWTEPRLLAALNSALQALCHLKPDAHTVHEDLALVEGTEQKIPEDAHGILEIMHNVCPETGQAKRAITLSDQSAFDAACPQWRQDKPTGYVKQWMKSDGNEETFLVWPPVPVAVDPPVPVVVRANLPKVPCVVDLTASAPVVPEEPVDPGAVTGTGFDDPVVPVELDPATTGLTVTPNGNGVSGLRVATTSPVFQSVETDSQTQGHTSGKFMWSVTADDVSGGAAQRTGIGITSVNVDQPAFTDGAFGGILGNNAVSYGYYSNGRVHFNNVVIGTEDAYTNGDQLHCYLDLDVGEFSVAINTGPPTVIATGLTGSWWPALSMSEGGTGTHQFTIRLHQDDLGNVPAPDGYVPWGARIAVDGTTQEDVDKYLALFAEYSAAVAALDAFNLEHKNDLKVEDELPVDKIYHPFLNEWSLYYSYLVDDEMTPNYSRAQAHFKKAFDLLGLRIQGQMAIKEVREAQE